jgi:hypothetical protein
MKIIGYILIFLFLISILYITWNGIKINLHTSNIDIEYELYSLKRFFGK